jgi:hypothetical protein
MPRRSSLSSAIQMVGNSLTPYFHPGGLKPVALQSPGSSPSYASRPWRAFTARQPARFARLETTAASSVNSTGLVTCIW